MVMEYHLVNTHKMQKETKELTIIKYMKLSKLTLYELTLSSASFERQITTYTTPRKVNESMSRPSFGGYNFTVYVLC